MLPRLGAVAPLILALAVHCRPSEAQGRGGSPAADFGAGRAHTGNAGFERQPSFRHPLYELRVTSVEQCVPPPLAAPPAGTRRIGIELELRPLGDIQIPANPYYARLVDENGDVHDATLGGCGTALAPTLPERDQPARGFVVFDVPRRSSRFTLLYAPELVGAPKEQIVLELGR